MAGYQHAFNHTTSPIERSWGPDRTKEGALLVMARDVQILYKLCEEDMYPSQQPSSPLRGIQSWRFGRCASTAMRRHACRMPQTLMRMIPTAPIGRPVSAQPHSSTPPFSSPNDLPQTMDFDRPSQSLSPTTAADQLNLRLPATCDPPSEHNPPKKASWIVSVLKRPLRCMC